MKRLGYHININNVFQQLYLHYCNKTVNKVGICSICKKRAYHESCAKSVCEISNNLIKYPRCKGSEVKRDQNHVPRDGNSSSKTYSINIQNTHEWLSQNITELKSVS